MIKIKTNSTFISEHFKTIKAKFLNFKLTKKEDKKVLWEITYDDIDNIVKSKLSGFKPDISFEKLITADYDYLKSLAKYIDKHKDLCAVSQNEKRYFLELYSRLNKPEFINRLNVNVCPYCNRNYILNFNINKKNNATAQLDHFFDKKSYPYLAVSFYNLVPSCSTCNQRKSTRNENIYYPYSESFNDDAKFRYKGIKELQENEDIFFLDAKRVQLEIEATRNKDKVKKHIEVFNIKNLYEEHKDIVSELLQKAEIYNDSYLNELMQNYEGTLFKNREDLLRLVTCGYVNDEDLHKRPLSKLIKDISEELKLV